MTSLVDGPSVAACGTLLAATSCLMVWGRYGAPRPGESAFILFDEPAFTGIDLAQAPWVIGLAALAGAATLLSVRIRNVGSLWLLRLAAVGVISVGGSIFFTAATDSFDETLVLARGSRERVSLNTLDGLQSRLGGKALFTQNERFRFEVGSLGPILGGVIISIATFLPGLRHPV